MGPSSGKEQQTTRRSTPEQCVRSSPGLKNTTNKQPTKKFFNNLQIWYTNADTLTKSKMSELESSIKISHPDIICITEVNPKNPQEDVTDEAYNIDGYNMFKSNVGRGIIIYSAHHLLASELEVSTGYESSLWTNIQITKSHNIIVGAIYRSPSSDIDNNNNLIELLKEVSHFKHDHMVITGDFNLKQIDWSTHTVRGENTSYQHQIFDCVNDLFLTETIKEPTRFRGTNTPSALDWILTNNSQCIHDIKVGAPLGLSDHSLISLLYQCNLENDDLEDHKHFSFFNGDYKSMREECASIDWNKELENKNTQQTWDHIHSRLTGLIERHVPKKKFTHSKSPPWYGREIGTLSNHKRKVWHRYKKIHVLKLGKYMPNVETH